MNCRTGKIISLFARTVFHFIQYPRLVVPSYLIAFGYCVADAASAGYQVMSEDDNIKAAKESRSKIVRAATAGIDTLLWQGKCVPICFTSIQ